MNEEPLEVGAGTLPRLDGVDDPVLTLGGGVDRGSFEELGGGGGGGGTAGNDISDRALRLLLMGLAELLLFPLPPDSEDEGVLLGGGIYELPVGGVGGTSMLEEDFIGKAGVWSRSAVEYEACLTLGRSSAE